MGENMLLKITIYLFALISIFGFYAFISYKKEPNEFDSSLIRRLYYLFTVGNIYAFLVTFHKDLANIKIVTIENVDTKSINLTITALTLIIISIVWEHTFISCKTLKNFKFKDLEISIDDLAKVKHIDKFQEKQINFLYSVLRAKIKMLKYIDYYIKNNELEPNQSYKDILQEYSKKRKNIDIFTYTNNNQGLKNMQKKIRLTPQQISSITYSIKLHGFCTPENFRSQDYMFALIKTKYMEDDIIVVLKSNFIIDREYLILIDIINYFEIKIELLLLQENIEEVPNTSNI